MNSPPFPGSLVSRKPTQLGFDFITIGPDAAFAVCEDFVVCRRNTRTGRSSTRSARRICPGSRSFPTPTTRTALPITRMR